jgi:hypothetical protein
MQSLRRIVILRIPGVVTAVMDGHIVTATVTVRKRKHIYPCHIYRVMREIDIKISGETLSPIGLGSDRIRQSRFQLLLIAHWLKKSPRLTVLMIELEIFVSPLFPSSRTSARNFLKNRRHCFDINALVLLCIEVIQVIVRFACIVARRASSYRRFEFRSPCKYLSN